MSEPNTTETVLLGIIDYTEAKRLRAALEDRGVALELRSNPGTCSTGGCKPTVEIHASRSDAEKFMAFVHEERSKALEGLAFNPELASEVFDSEKETARCPACATEFSTKLQECPDCGLFFGGGPAED